MPETHDARARVAATAVDPLVGRVVDGRYRIRRRIARGGMAGVYEATDLRLDRVVAVKVMHAGLGDDEDFAARFVREARSAARIDHPNVVNVFDQGEDDGVVFLAMEYVPGRTLRDVLRAEAPLAPARALALFEPVTAAIAAAHRGRLIHRDIKPENVLIADDGRVKVADFGLAKAVSADTQHTATGGVLIGTVSYLAPELVVDGRADARADVYALGVMLYELLTGSKPHEGESPIAVAYKHVHEDVPAPSAAAAGVPAYVDALVARATARDRTHPPADAGVLLRQVRRVAQALADGVLDDADLELDLRPPTLHVVPGDPGAAHPPAARVDTRAEGGLSLVREPERTTSLRASPGADHRPAPPAPAPRRTTQGGGPPSGPGRPRRRSRWKGPLAVLLAVLLAAGAGVGVWWFGYERYTLTPGVMGMDEAAAVRTLEAAGLGVTYADPKYEYTENGKYPAGTVLHTDPGSGSRILDGGTVTLTLSLGKERYDVPPLRELTEDAAQDALLQAHLTFGESTREWSEVVPAGQVIRSDPAAGTTIPPRITVDLVLSRGPRPIEVADWTGKDADDAERALTRKGLQVAYEDEEFSDTVAEGDVIRQDPSSGTLTRGDTVTLTVSQGPELFEVPDVYLSGVEAAKETLRDAGFEVRTEEADNYYGLGFVTGQDPEGGSMQPRGTTITLYVI